MCTLDLIVSILKNIFYAILITPFTSPTPHNVTYVTTHKMILSIFPIYNVKGMTSSSVSSVNFFPPVLNVTIQLITSLMTQLSFVIYVFYKDA